MIVGTHSEDKISETTCIEWYQPYKSDDFNIEDKERP